MKLHTGHVRALHDGGERPAVFRDGNGIARERCDEAVGEVHLRVSRDAVHDRIGPSNVQRVPSDVRNLDRRAVHIAWQPIALTREHAEPGGGRRLIAALE